MDDYNKFPIQINYDKISKAKDFMPFVRLLAVDLIENPYLSIGTFLKGMSDSDLSTIMDLIEEDEDSALEHILITTEMLAQAEGLVSEDLDELTSRCNIMMTYFAMESLRRKGMIRLFYENLSFGDDYGDKIIAERVE